MSKYKHKATGVIAEIVPHIIYRYYSIDFSRPDICGVTDSKLPASMIENSNDWEKIEENSFKVFYQGSGACHNKIQKVVYPDGKCIEVDKIYHKIECKHPHTVKVQSIHQDIGGRFYFISEENHHHYDINSENIYIEIEENKWTAEYNDRLDKVGYTMSNIRKVTHPAGRSIEVGKTYTESGIIKKLKVDSIHKSHERDIYYFHANGNNYAYVINMPQSPVYIEIKEEKPLFRTEDGIDIYNGNTFWKIVNNNSCIGGLEKINIMAHESLIDPRSKSFWFDNKAEEYITNNAKVLSLNDVAIIMDPSWDLYNDTRLKFRKLIKDRLDE